LRLYIHVTCASCSCQLNVIESMGDFGVVSYLADADGNVIIGPTTPVPTPSPRSVPTTPSPSAPTLTSTPANTNPQNKTRATPTPKNQTPSTERSSTPPAQIPKNQTPGSPTPENQTSETLILSTSNTSTPQPSTPTSDEKSANTSMDNEKITAMLKDSVDNLGLSTLETELVDAMHLTEHEATTSSEPDESTPALETENLENVCETKDD
ncbi:hypothetical protein cypCar_00024748, partial [Cyprinus carpio]